MLIDGYSMWVLIIFIAASAIFVAAFLAGKASARRAPNQRGGVAAFLVGKASARRAPNQRGEDETPSDSHWHCVYPPWYGEGTCALRHKELNGVWHHTGTVDTVDGLVPLQCECPDPRPFELAAKEKWLGLHGATIEGQ